MLRRKKSKGLWTEGFSREFYGNVNALSAKLKSTESPKIPKDYGVSSARPLNSQGYLLSYKEELHLADHFAFLAHAYESVECVSAATFEEIDEPKGFCVRLASNQTPQKRVVDGLNVILGIVQNGAREGKHGKKVKSMLFDEVVKLSQQRIYGRIRSSHDNAPTHRHGLNQLPLYKRITRNLGRAWPSPSQQSPEIVEIREALMGLRDSLERVDTGSPEDQLDLLKVCILQSHAISNQGSSTSLENNLLKMGFSKRISQSREVLQIDKLSKYWQVCIDLISLSRKDKTRTNCKNLKLAICESFPSFQPPGALNPCFVHGEVQLILFHRENPSMLPPRALGSSKSACFLCDLFVNKHACFGMSHAHMKLYTRWTLPDCKWMSPQELKKIQDIVNAMNIELQSLLRRKSCQQNILAESRVPVLHLKRTASIASSLPSTILLEANNHSDPRLLIQKSLGSSTVSLVNAPFTRTTYTVASLPVMIQILPWTQSCTLIAGKTDYIFDLSDLPSGALHLCEGSPQNNRGKEVVNTNDLNTESSVIIKAKMGFRALVFYIRDRELCFRVTVTWR